MPQGLNISIQDQGLGQSPPGGANILAVVGVSSAGVANAPLQTSAPSNITANFGVGPGPQLATLVAASSGQPVIFIKASTVTAGVLAGSVQATVPGGSTSVVSVTGVPFDTYYFRATVVTGGTVGTPGIQVNLSLDAGRTIYQVLNLGSLSTFAVNNTGLTITFGAGTLVAGDYFSIVAVEPKWSDSTLTSALQSLVQSVTAFEDVVVAGDVPSSSAVNLDAQATALFNKRRYTRILCNARDAVWGGTSTESEAQWIASIQSDYQSYASLRVGVSAGHYNVVSPIDQSQYRRPLSWLAAVRDASVLISEDLGYVGRGPLSPLTLPSSPDGFIYHDEQVNPGLDAARFMAAIRYIGFPGIFIQNGNLMAPPGSDFNWLQHGHVVDTASYIIYYYLTNVLGKSLRVNSTTGFILSQDAATLEQNGNAQLAANLVAPGHVSSATFSVVRNNNILATNTLIGVVSIVPLAYPKTINVTIQYVNPAVSPV